MSRIVDNIFVIDDVINNQYANRIEEDILYNQNIHYYFNNNMTEKSQSKINNGKYGFGITFGNHIFTPLLLDAAEKAGEGYNVKDVIETRSFITLPTLNDDGTHGKPHIDSPNPHNVCLYYVNDSDGDTIFFESKDSNNIIGRIKPKKNRAVVFPGNIYHANYWPVIGPRVIINMIWTANI